MCLFKQPKPTPPPPLPPPPAPTPEPAAPPKQESARAPTAGKDVTSLKIRRDRKQNATVATGSGGVGVNTAGL